MSFENELHHIYGFNRKTDIVILKVVYVYIEDAYI